EQERRRHAHRRNAISGVLDFAQRSVLVPSIRSAVDQRIASSAPRKLGSKRSGEEHLLHALLGGKDREERDSVPRRAGSRWQRSFDRRLDSLSGSRPSGDAFLVHPLRESADASTYRPDARWRVPDRKREDCRTRNELPLQRQSGRIAKEHKEIGPSGTRARPRRRRNGGAPAILASNFHFTSVSDAV